MSELQGLFRACYVPIITKGAKGYSQEPNRQEPLPFWSLDSSKRRKMKIKNKRTHVRCNKHCFEREKGGKSTFRRWFEWGGWRRHYRKGGNGVKIWRKSGNRSLSRFLGVESSGRVTSTRKDWRQEMPVRMEEPEACTFLGLLAACPPLRAGSAPNGHGITTCWTSASWERPL